METGTLIVIGIAVVIGVIILIARNKKASGGTGSRRDNTGTQSHK